MLIRPSHTSRRLWEEVVLLTLTRPHAYVCWRAGMSSLKCAHFDLHISLRRQLETLHGTPQFICKSARALMCVLCNVAPHAEIEIPWRGWCSPRSCCRCGQWGRRTRREPSAGLSWWTWVRGRSSAWPQGCAGCPYGVVCEWCLPGKDGQSARWMREGS